MRAELLQKSVDAQSTLKKASAPTIPLRSRGMPRKMTDTTPLKGIPSRMPTSGFRSPITTGSANRPNLSRTPAGKKEGGVKLIDFSEQPIGLASAKRRKKQEAEEAHKKALAEAAEQAAAAAASSNSATSALANSNATQATDSDSDAGLATNSATPDYAAGLTASSIYTQPQTPAPATKLDNGGPVKGKPVPPLVPVNSGHDVSAEDIEMVDEDEDMDGQSQEEDANDHVDEEDDDDAEGDEVADDNDMEEDGDEEEQPQPAQPRTLQQIQPQPTIVTNNMGTIKLQTAQGATTPSGLIIKTIDPHTHQQQQRMPFNQIYGTATGNTIIQSPSTSHIQMPPGITVVSSTTAGGQPGTPTKIVQIKTAPTTYMMSPQGPGTAPPPLIATQQTQQPQYMTLQQAQQQLGGKKTVLVTTSGGHQQLATTNTGNVVFVPQQQAGNQQQGQAMQTAQIITNAAGQRFVMTPQKIGGGTTINTIGGGQQAAANNKPIILSNQTLSTGSKGVIIRSIGPTGAPVYSQIPMSSVTRLQGLGTGGATFIQKKPDLPALVPTSGAMVQMVQQQQSQQQQQPTLITATRAPQQRAPGTTIIRPVLASNVQQIQGLQGYTIVQRGGPGQATLIQAIPQQQQQQQQQPQQVQQVQRIITQQPAQQVMQQQQQAQLGQQVKRQIVVQQPARKGLTLAVSDEWEFSGQQWTIM